MKNILTIVGLICLFSPQWTFAQGQKNYFSGQTLEVAKTVQIVGAQRTAENLEREEHVGKIVELQQARLRFCYERALATNSINLETTFYFSVSNAGQFGNLTADFVVLGKNNDKDNSEYASVTLLKCVAQQLSHIRAGQGKSDLTFRFKVRFEANSAVENL